MAVASYKTSPPEHPICGLLTLTELDYRPAYFPLILFILYFFYTA